MSSRAKTSRTASMRAVMIRAHGGPEVLIEEQRPVPAPGAGEVLVRVRACALNHLDLWVRQGVPGHTFPLPMIPGCDVAGTIEKVGPSVPANVARGDSVVVSPGLSCGTCVPCLSGKDNFCASYGILGETRDGGCAEFVAVPARNLLPLPSHLSFEEAATIPLSFLTAWHMLVDRAQVRPGETVLVQAAGSGVGSAAIQIAKLWGAKVITTTGSARKVKRARSLGADEVIDYSRQDFTTEVRRITGKRGVDVVIEHVGGEIFSGSLKCLTRGGRLVTCGSTAGHEVGINLRVVFFKSLSILGSTMGGKGELAALWRHVESGRLKPVLDEVLPLGQIAKAHQMLEERKAFGKVVLTP